MFSLLKITLKTTRPNIGFLQPIFKFLLLRLGYVKYIIVFNQLARNNTRKFHMATLVDKFLVELEKFLADTIS